MSVGQAGNHSTAPQVVIDELVYQKIMHWVNKSNYEVSGLGKLVVEDGVIRVIDAILLPQKNTATTTDIEAADVGKAAFLLKDTPGDLRFWWHSHVNMNVFWSGTDLATIKALAEGGWFVSTVFNKRHETKTCIAMNDPFPLMYDDVRLTIERVLPQDLVNKWNNEYEQKVTNVVPKLVPAAAVQRWQPHQSSSVLSSTLTPDEREEIARLAKLMTDEDASEVLTSGLGGRETWGGFDWTGMEDLEPTPGHRREHEKSGSTTIQERLDARDRLEDKVDLLEERIDFLNNKGKQIPRQLEDALDVAQADLDEVEDELDVLEKAGLLTPEDRYKGRMPHPEMETTSYGD